MPAVTNGKNCTSLIPTPAVGSSVRLPSLPGWSLHSPVCTPTCCEVEQAVPGEWPPPDHAPCTPLLWQHIERRELMVFDRQTLCSLTGDLKGCWPGRGLCPTEPHLPKVKKWLFTRSEEAKKYSTLLLNLLQKCKEYQLPISRICFNTLLVGIQPVFKVIQGYKTGRCKEVSQQEGCSPLAIHHQTWSLWAVTTAV